MGAEIKTTTQATPLAVSGQSRIQCEDELRTAVAERDAAAAGARQMRRSLLYHKARLLAVDVGQRIGLGSANVGIPGWVAALAIGSTIAVASAGAVIYFLGAGLPAVFTTVVVAYGVCGGGVLWFLRDLSDETAENRLLIRRQKVQQAREKLHAAKEVLAQKTKLVGVVRQRLQAVQEELRSDAYRHQIETERLLSVDPGRLYPDEFERHVADIFKHLGFTIDVVGKSGDQGVDILARRGLLRVAIQAKRYIGAVGNTAVQEVYAGMAHHRCQRCAVITNSTFTPSAIALAESTKCLLIAGDQIEQLIRGNLDFPSQ